MRLKLAIDPCPLCGGRHEQPDAFYWDEQRREGLTIVCPTPPPTCLGPWFPGDEYVARRERKEFGMARLLGHDSYRRGHGGALRQVRRG